MKLTKKGEIVLAIGTLTLAVAATYGGLLVIKSLLLIWELRGYDVR